MSAKCGIAPKMYIPLLGKRRQKKVVYFHAAVSVFPKGEKHLGDSPESPALPTWPGQLSPGTSLPCQKKFGFFH